MKLTRHREPNVFGGPRMCAEPDAVYFKKTVGELNYLAGSLICGPVVASVGGVATPMYLRGM